jgi:MFS family permease
LFAGITVKNLGNGIAPVALAFAVIDLGGSATELGLVVGLYAVAEVVAIMYGGVLGDRLSRTVMMQGTTAAASLVSSGTASPACSSRPWGRAGAWRSTPSRSRSPPVASR